MTELVTALIMVMRIILTIMMITNITCKIPTVHQISFSARDSTTSVCPVIDVIDTETLAYQVKTMIMIVMKVVQLKPKKHPELFAFSHCHKYFLDPIQMPQDNGYFAVGGFDWNLQFNW